MEVFVKEHGPVASLCCQEQGSDFRLRCAAGTVTLPIHSPVLKSHSRFFEIALDPDSPFVEAQTGLLVKDHWGEAETRFLLQLCYTGKADVPVSDLAALVRCAMESECLEVEAAARLACARAVSAETLLDLAELPEPAASRPSLSDAVLHRALRSWSTAALEDMRTLFLDNESRDLCAPVIEHTPASGATVQVYHSLYRVEHQGSDDTPQLSAPVRMEVECERASSSLEAASAQVDHGQEQIGNRDPDRLQELLARTRLQAEREGRSSLHAALDHLQESMGMRIDVVQSAFTGPGSSAASALLHRTTALGNSPGLHCARSSQSRNSRRSNRGRFNASSASTTASSGCGSSSSNTLDVRLATPLCRGTDVRDLADELGCAVWFHQSPSLGFMLGGSNNRVPTFSGPAAKLLEVLSALPSSSLGDSANDIRTSLQIANMSPSMLCRLLNLLPGAVAAGQGPRAAPWGGPGPLPHRCRQPACSLLRAAAAVHDEGTAQRPDCCGTAHPGWRLRYG
eukprot:TRINITY_DN18551_c0_g1_i1.p1 TRINITY_DN18551_c0_g1~~TRINITY_DN18551_c0_g1_i1.p1  ORF type:complete len:523 (-),score=74.78 TRINITY_DN18551_c0_g1_i1:630-2165(-)